MIQRGDAPGTVRNRRLHQHSYTAFCEEYWYKPFPATQWRYCQYAMYLHNQDKVPETVQNYMGSIRTIHKLKDLDPGDPTNIHYKKLTEGLKKTCKKPVKQAVCMDQDLLRKLFPYVKFQDELEAVAWVAVLVGFSVLLRVSNLGPRARKDFDPEMHFVRGGSKYQKRRANAGGQVGEEYTTPESNYVVSPGTFT